MSQYNTDPASACCGDPGDCSQAHLYCFNRTPKEADTDAMEKFEQDKLETPEQRKAFDVAFDAKRAGVQAQINAATHGSTYPNGQNIFGDGSQLENGSPPMLREPTIADVRAGMAAVDAQIERLEAQVALEPDPENWGGVKDDIKRPDHYARFAIEPCTFIMLNELPYWAGNVVKYVTRAPHKHKDERIDIRKAIRYCEMRIEELDRVAAGTDGDVIGNPL